MGFRFKSKESPDSYVSNLAGAMQKYAPEHVLSGPWLYAPLDSEGLASIRSILSLLTPENLRIEIVSQTFKGKTDLRERWYNTEYSVEGLSESLIQRLRDPGLNDELSLPAPNDFIATDFRLRNAPSAALVAEAGEQKNT